MYLPQHFEVRDPKILRALVREHPLATVIVGDPGGLAADHLPLHWRDTDRGEPSLVGHVARANPLARKALPDGVPVLAVFQGPQHYISPGWYASKARDPRVVPTWNYQVVHITGRLRVREDPKWMLGLLTDLTAAHEAGRPHPWHPGELPQEALERMMGAIVGVEIGIQAMVGKWKVSQNQSPENRASVAAGLRSVGSDAATAMADAVERAGPPPSPGTDR